MTSLSPALQRLLDQLSSADQLSFFSLVDAIYSVRFTGPTTIDWHNGVPKQISFGQPVKLAICAGGSNGQGSELEGGLANELDSKEGRGG